MVGAMGANGRVRCWHPALHLLRQFRAAPNLLTLARLFLIPYLVIAILDGHFRLAFLMFIAAGVSDGLDGLLARMFHQRTKLGEYLDPIADKLLMSTMFLVLTHVGVLPRYVTVLVFSRDLGILLIATLLFVTGTLRDFKPSVLGKLNTFLQIVGLVTVMVGQVYSLHWIAVMAHVLVRAIALMAPLSAAQYAWIVLRRMSAKEAAANAG